MADDWTTSYRAIARPTARGIVRGLSLDALSRAGELTGRTERALARPRVHFIYLHHIFDDEVEAFRKLLASLTKTMTPISYSAAIERCLNGPIDKPYVAFSFDDGMKNCVAAARVLEEFGATACFFICPRIIAEKVDDERVRQWVRFAHARLHLPPTEFMTWDDLDGLRSRGHEIGNHTADHLRLSEVADPREQIEHGLATLRLRYSNVKHFAWPYGNFASMNDAAREAVFATGHASCASGVRGAHVEPASDATKLCVRRDHIIAAWSLRHVRYLLAKSASAATAADNEWPVDLSS
jgi:peptidoglycan/xylan/chitin deacetylase (PgdA/CDA1 family)